MFLSCGDTLNTAVLGDHEVRWRHAVCEHDLLQERKQLEEFGVEIADRALQLNGHFELKPDDQSAPLS